MPMGGNAGPMAQMDEQMKARRGMHEKMKHAGTPAAPSSMSTCRRIASSVPATRRLHTAP